MLDQICNTLCCKLLLKTRTKAMHPGRQTANGLTIFVDRDQKATGEIPMFEEFVERHGLAMAPTLDKMRAFLRCVI